MVRTKLDVKMEALAKGQINLQIRPIDTWFFRESRPHDAAGASELSSLFPPPIRTLAGALRSFIGERLEIDWRTLRCENSDFDFKSVLGDANTLGQMELNGAWICYQGKRLYPAPVYLMLKDKNVQRLLPGKPVRCDLGEKVRLPELPREFEGYKALGNAWLTAKGMAKCLNNSIPDEQDIIGPDKLFSYETRLGIAVDNKTRNVIDKQLYQTRHLRLSPDVHIELDIKTLPDEVIACLPTDNAVIRFGGEGRMASIQAQTQAEPMPCACADAIDTIALHFITPAGFSGSMFPKGFEQTELNDKTVWQGVINDIELSIEAAVIGKVQREGGWDMEKHEPRAVQSYIPGGSVWFCRLNKHYDKQALRSQLHGRCLGDDSAYGRGHILLGHWQDTHIQPGK